jgi:starvation-inducible DNA-binding protein
MAMELESTDTDRKALADELSRLLADSYTLYVMTHSYHWNVTGPMFPMLHAMFEEQYVELAEAVDEIAERIRALGEPAPGTLTEFEALSSIEHVPGAPAAEDMIRKLLAAHEAIARTARGVVKHAEEAGDPATADLVTGRVRAHEKTAWMLRSLLEG